MKAIRQFFAGIALAIPLLGVGVVWGNSSVVGGNVIVNRPFVDSFKEFYMMDTNHPINVDGKLDRWEIYAGTRESVQLVIYRQQEDGSFFVVGKSDVRTPELVGYNQFLLDPKIPVRAGDFVGAYSYSSDPLEQPIISSPIVFNYDPPLSLDSQFFDQYDPTSKLIGTTLFTDPGASHLPNELPEERIVIDFSLSSNRHYSIRVRGERWQEENCQISIERAEASPNVLWPPNNKMVSVRVEVSTSNTCDTAPSLVCTIDAISSNESLSTDDWQITGPLTVSLRATRTGGGDGRVYKLEGECVDVAGNGVPWSTTVTVPHDQGKK